MKNIKPGTSRKKFLIGGAALLSSLTFFKFFSSRKKPRNDTIKMLTQDGQLVEIDRSLVSSGGRKISNDELKNWVKK